LTQLLNQVGSVADTGTAGLNLRENRFPDYWPVSHCPSGQDIGTAFWAHQIGSGRFGRTQEFGNVAVNFVNRERFRNLPRVGSSICSISALQENVLPRSRHRRALEQADCGCEPRYVRVERGQAGSPAPYRRDTSVWAWSKPSCLRKPCWLMGWGHRTGQLRATRTDVRSDSAAASSRPN